MTLRMRQLWWSIKGEYGLGPQKIRIEESAVIFVANPNKPHNMELP
jgi:hypothetical protein